jgi:putative transposase
MPLFHSASRLTFLHDNLLRLSSQYGWNLQAWSVFPNHYHFVASSDVGRALRDLIQHFHGSSSNEVNRLDGISGRKVWLQYWETRITNQKSYFARLRYVHENAVHHGVASRAANYSWCSAAWFERTASPAFQKVIQSFPCDRIAISDGFAVSRSDIGEV